MSRQSSLLVVQGLLHQEKSYFQMTLSCFAVFADSTADSSITNVLVVSETCVVVEQTVLIASLSVHQCIHVYVVQPFSSGIGWLHCQDMYQISFQMLISISPAVLVLHEED